MNIVAKNLDFSKNEFLVGFNQDCTSLTVSTTNGYRILSLFSVDSLQETCENEMDDICIVERLFSSSLLAIVSLSSPRKLKVCHFKKGTEICNYSYSNTILAVKLNRLRLVVCLEESLYIHNIRDMKVLHTIRDTPPNPNGLCALSIDCDNSFLAYPASSTIGELQIFDTVNMHCKMMIAAHDSPLAALAFSYSGQLIATASEKGTVIRVFNVTDGAKLFEFRRGVKRCVNISGLAFSPDGMFLAASSNTETVHIFKLDDPKNVPPRPQTSEENQGWMGYLTKAVSVSANLLPTQVTGVFTQGRAFASVRLPIPSTRNVCALTMIEKVMRLVVACSGGQLYICNFDPVEGGECQIIKQHRLLKKNDLSSPSGACQFGSSNNG